MTYRLQTFTSQVVESTAQHRKHIRQISISKLLKLLQREIRIESK